MWSQHPARILLTFFLLLLTADAFAEATKLHKLPDAPAGVNRVELIYDKDLLLSAPLVLPQFYVVDLITGRLASTKTMPTALANFVKKHANYGIDGKPTKTHPSLTDLLHALRHADGSPVNAKDLANHHFAAFQYWAEWCEGCFQEAHDFTELLNKRSIPDLIWVAVEADPIKAQGLNPDDVVHKVNPSEHLPEH